MLFDPFEEQLDLPALPIQIGNHSGGQVGIVGQEDQSLAIVVARLDTSNGARVGLGRCIQRQRSDLIEDDVAVGTVHKSRVASLEFGVALGSCDKESTLTVDSMESGEIEVAPIHQVEGIALDQQVVEYIDLVQFAVADVNETGDVAAQIEQRMHLHCSLGSTKWSPRVQRQTKVDGGRIECVNGCRQIDAKRLVHIKRTGDADQVLAQVGINLPGPRRIGMSQGVARDRLAAEAQSIQSRRLRAQIDLNIAQRLSVGELSKGHRQELIEAREVLNLVIALVPSHASAKCREWQMRHDLSEYEFALMHWNSTRMQTAKGAKLQNRCSNRDQRKTSIYPNKSLTYTRSM